VVHTHAIFHDRAAVHVSPQQVSAPLQHVPWYTDIQYRPQWQL